MKHCKVCEAIVPAYRSKKNTCSDICDERLTKHQARMRKVIRDANASLAVLIGVVERDDFGDANRLRRYLRGFQIKITRATGQPTLFDDGAFDEFEFADENEIA